jgi:hypothetical protein
VRLREEGHVFFGEDFLMLLAEDQLSENLAKAADGCRALDWRLHDIVLMPVRSLDEDERSE